VETDIDPSCLTVRWTVAAEGTKCTLLPTPRLEVSCGVLNSGKAPKELRETEGFIVFNSKAPGVRKW
jgi:hypothetical protein